MSHPLACDRCSPLTQIDPGSIGSGAQCRICGLVPKLDEAGYGLAPVVIFEEPRLVAVASEPVPEPGFWSALATAAGVEASRVEGMTVLLIALSALDLLMTFTLLRTSPAFYESNPLARFVFERWNMTGMSCFKFGVIGGVVALGELIERRRPGWGRFVLAVGCVAALAAIGQGLRLYLGHVPAAGWEAD